jgi:hypothetical protein
MIAQASMPIVLVFILYFRIKARIVFIRIAAIENNTTMILTKMSAPDSLKLRYKINIEKAIINVKNVFAALIL